MSYQHPYEYVTKYERLWHIANEIATAEFVALDLETTPKPEWKHRPGAAFSPYFGDIRLFSINTGKGVYVIDVFQVKDLAVLIQALHNPNAETGKGRPVVIGQNLKFDQRYLLQKYGLELWPVFDTFLASAMLHNGKGLGHNLWDLFQRELYEKPQVQDLGGSDWGRPVLTKEQLDYAADDVVKLPRLRDVLKPKLAAAGLNRVALIEFGAILPAVAVELNGFPFDQEAWLQLAASNRVKRDALGIELLKELPNPTGQLSLPGAFDWLYGPDVLSQWADSAREAWEGDEAGAEGEDESAIVLPTAPQWSEVQEQLRRAARPRGSKKTAHFNLDSQGQMLASLRRLNQALSKLPDTAEATLAMEASKYPVIQKLLKYREVSTRLKSFGPDFLKNINPVTGRIHVDYYPLLVTGRYAHRNPNLGQIPRDKAFRKCFKTKKGRKLTLSDYSMIELVIMAELTQDPVLKRLLWEGKDVHRYTASRIARCAEEEVTKEQRQQAKPANFGFIYGLGAERFVVYAMVGYGVPLSLKDSMHIRDTFFREFAGVADWQEETLARGTRTLRSSSISGRLRYMTPKSYNEYLNHPDQATGADGLKTALRMLYFRLRKEFGPGVVDMVHHVHDEIIVEHDDDADLERQVQRVQSETMIEAMASIVKSVPVRAEPASGFTWADKS